MPVKRSRTYVCQSRSRQAVNGIYAILLFALLYIVSRAPDANIRRGTKEKKEYKLKVQSPDAVVQSLRERVSGKGREIRRALEEALSGSELPTRLQTLRERREIVGERLIDVREGTKTVEEILHESIGQVSDSSESSIIDKPPMSLDEIIEYLTDWIHNMLHDALFHSKKGTPEDIWKAYHDLTVKTLYPWDRDYLSRMPKHRDDGSIFVSLASYRDENCFNTMTQAYEKSKNPDKLFFGLVQQNCHRDCKSGILEGGKLEDVEPDDDCYKLFCDSDIGKSHCEAKQVRVLNFDENDSLGPYAARFFASKLWYGEQWFMQIDAHMTFATHWDKKAIDDLQNAPSKKPVLSHYPSSSAIELDYSDLPASRLCGPVFATTDLESQIIRLDGSGQHDITKQSTPRFAPFAAAGFFVANSLFLSEVPFDPFLPWIFMGEEIIMSSRLWTSGYDIFSPTENVVGHIYVRRHKPKFWEALHRAFSPGIHNPLQRIVLDRIKYQLGDPEAASDIVHPKTLLTAVKQYSMGNYERTLDQYMRMVGLNVTTKEVYATEWCESGLPPPVFDHYSHLYGVEKL